MALELFVQPRPAGSQAPSANSLLSLLFTSIALLPALATLELLRWTFSCGWLLEGLTVLAFGGEGGYETARAPRRPLAQMQKSTPTRAGSWRSDKLLARSAGGLQQPQPWSFQVDPGLGGRPGGEAKEMPGGRGGWGTGAGRRRHLGAGQGKGRRRDFHPIICQVDFASALILETKTQALKIRATDNRTGQELIAK